MRRTGGEVVIANVNSVKLNIIYLYILSIACFSPVIRDQKFAVIRNSIAKFGISADCIRSR